MGGSKISAANAVEEQAQQFGAFISYSHADAVRVRKLHSQLEAYRLPTGLGEISTLNRRDGGLGRVFRDREDLSAAQDLSSAVTDALDRSHVLVVACSPAAKASRWVNQEIAYFKDRYPSRPILAAILDGEPVDAFPSALMADGTEPLAADLRKEGDGWQLGFLKVVAGIAGVPLDALIQRNAQRQMRRVIAVTCLVALVSIAMGVMTTIALQARDEAQALRVSSDAFVEEQLTQGREDLAEAGSPELQQKFNERTLKFFARQREIGALPDDSLELWARLLHSVGEDYKAVKDYKAAQDAFDRARAVTAELLEREPNNPDRVFAHAQSQYWVGSMYEKDEDFQTAKQWYVKYHQSALRLKEIEPGSRRTALEIGYAANNLGIIELGEKNLSQAQSLFEEAISQFSAALPLSGDDLPTLVERNNSRAWLASVYYQSGDLETSRIQRVEQLSELETIVSQDPDDRRYQYKKIVAEYSILKIDERLGRRNLAPRRTDLLARISSLRDIAPEVATWAEMERKIRAISAN